MSFEFFTPEGVSVRCETVDELTDAYTALWRNHEHTAYGFYQDDEVTAPHEEAYFDEGQLVPVRSLASLPPLEEPAVEQQDVLHMPPHWAKVWQALATYGQSGASVPEIAEDIERNKHTVSSVFSLMYHQGFIEKGERRGKWRVPKEIRNHHVVVGRLLPLEG